jgi:hypothetical protein
MDEQNPPDVWDTYDWNEPFDLETFPLEQPPGFDMIDWGGDGSDLTRPVRAHVLEALVPTDAPYPAAVASLRNLGKPNQPGVEIRRNKLDFDQSHVPDLVRMARDRELNTALGDTDAAYAPIHAVYVLAGLDIADVVEEIIPLLNLQNDWVDVALVEMLGRAGEVALEPLVRYLHDPTRWHYGRTYAADALAKMARFHPELWPRIVPILRGVLQNAAQHDAVINSFIISSLLGIQAVEALPEMRQAFELGQVDEMIHGDWGRILKELGQEPDPDDPLLEKSVHRWKTQHRNMRKRAGLPADPDAPASAQSRSAPLPARLPSGVSGSSDTGKQSRKTRQKRKQSSAARKANQRKKKRK